MESPSSFISTIFYVVLLIPAAIPIHFAVSVLSPVNIHILIPAYLRDSIVP